MRRSSNDATSAIISATTSSSGSVWDTTRIAIVVGPAVVEWIAGGRTTISITSWEPPNNVTFGRVIVIQGAVSPAGMMT